MINYMNSRRLLLLLLLPGLVAGRSVRWVAFTANPKLAAASPRRNVNPWRVHVPLSQLRAGSTFPLATTTAKVTSAVLGINGMALLTIPHAFLARVHKIEPDMESKPLTTWILRATGALGTGLAIHVYSSIVTGGLATQTTMGLSLIPRALFFLYTIFTGQMRELNIQQRFFTINTILTLWCSCSLLFNLGKPAQTAKMYSLMCFLKSVLFMAAPNKVSIKLWGKPCEGQQLELVRGMGNELMTSALLMMASAWGATYMTPITAAGYTCLVWLLLLLADVAWVGKTSRLVGSEGSHRTQLVTMLIAGLSAAGFLLPK